MQQTLEAPPPHPPETKRKGKTPQVTFRFISLRFVSFGQNQNQKNVSRSRNFNIKSNIKRQPGQTDRQRDRHDGFLKERISKQASEQIVESQSQQRIDIYIFLSDSLARRGGKISRLGGDGWCADGMGRDKIGRDEMGCHEI